MTSITRQCLSLIGLMGILSILSPLSIANGAGQQAFEAGIDASREKKYELALQHFLKAREQGKDSAALYHNLGVAYFKLGRYAEAEEAFRKASQSTHMAAISYYNLGLVEERRENRSAADQWFSRAMEASRTPKLRRLAARKLGLRETADVRYSGYLELFGGHDDNPQLIDETSETLTTEKDGDAFLGGLVFGRYRMSGDSANGSYLYGSGYSRNYLDVDEENTASLTAGVGFRKRTGEWRNNFQLGAHRLWLDGDEVQTGYLASVRSRRDIGNDLILGFRFAGESLDGADDNGYGYLSGERFRFRTRLQGNTGAMNWDFSYEITHNDRDELVFRDNAGNIDTVYNVSPQRHEIEAGLDFPLTGLLKAELTGEYRISRYSDPEVRGGVDVEEREDDRFSARAGLAYPVGLWTTRLEASYWDNESNFERFDYSRTDIMLSVGRNF